MKKMISCLLLFSFFSACNSDDDVNVDVDVEQVIIEITSEEYQFTHTLFDPGDGSGEFMPVESDRILTWYSDSTFTCTEDICTGDETLIEGIYSPEDNILIFDCGSPLPEGLFYRYFFDQEDLIIALPCIEPCYFKYQKT